jgi:hypothetical protein
MVSLTTAKLLVLVLAQHHHHLTPLPAYDSRSALAHTAAVVIVVLPAA